MVGIIQEQHPDRTRLFMQWKKMNWPILVDSLNLLGVSVVPLTLFIDEHGIIRAVQPKHTDLEDFLKRRDQMPSGAPGRPIIRPDLAKLEKDAREGRPDALRAWGDAAILWGGAGRITQAIEAYRKALQKEPTHAPTHFRLGVAYRLRHDSPFRQMNDFQQASNHWAAALDLNPNNYIWRRRIQQFGPRLSKPYSFYDWVNQARQEILARGETPVPLSVEPSGAEFAYPSKNFEATGATKKEPDPQARILRDKGRLVKVETAAVPPTLTPGSTSRLHVIFRPNQQIKAHWNNEVDDLILWINPPDGWSVDGQHHSVPNPPHPVSQDTRTIEFEIKCPEMAAPGMMVIPAYALYYVCEDVNGTCLYRRQDVPLQIEVKPTKNETKR